MEQAHEVEVRLPHHVSVGVAATFLVGALGCDEWHVACQQEHVLLVRLTQTGQRRYAVRFECTTPIEKGIYHGRKTAMLAILPLGGQAALIPSKVTELKTGLAKLDS